jgi:hypothetical protein
LIFNFSQNFEFSKIETFFNTKPKDEVLSLTTMRIKLFDSLNEFEQNNCIEKCQIFFDIIIS